MAVAVALLCACEEAETRTPPPDAIRLGDDYSGEGTSFSQGFVCGWMYDAEAGKVWLAGIYSRKIFHFRQDELSPNVHLKIFKEKKLVYQVKLVWSNLLKEDFRSTKVVEGGKICCVRSHLVIAEDFSGEEPVNESFKICESPTLQTAGVPFSLEQVDSWEAWDLETNTILGKGALLSF